MKHIFRVFPCANTHYVGDEIDLFLGPSYQGGCCSAKCPNSSPCLTIVTQLSHNCIRSDGGLLSVLQCHNNRWSLCSESSKHRTQLPLEPFLHLVTSMKIVFEVLFDARFSVCLGHLTMTENWRNTLYFFLYISWTPHRGWKLMYLFLGCHKILRLPSKCLKTTTSSCLLLSN